MRCSSSGEWTCLQYCTFSLLCLLFLLLLRLLHMCNVWPSFVLNYPSGVGISVALLALEFVGQHVIEPQLDIIWFALHTAAICTFDQTDPHCAAVRLCPAPSLPLPLPFLCPSTFPFSDKAVSS